VNFEIRPPDLAPPAARYAHGVLSRGPAQLLHTSGVVPTRVDGTVPDTLEDQVALVWHNIDAIVRAGGMTLSDLVSITTYVVVGEPLAPVMAARDAALKGHLVASTLVTVPALAQPAWKVEIAAVAAR
jgi:2-iminobutanoate/2-iminopropanoate deaminase